MTTTPADMERARALADALRPLSFPDWPATIVTALADERARAIEAAAQDPDAVERVARAICVARGLKPDYCVHGSGFVLADGTGGSKCDRYTWQEYTGAARAAIRALADSPARLGLTLSS